MNPITPRPPTLSAILSVPLLLLAACSHRTPQATVDVIDTSRSITPRAEKAALDAVQSQIAHMQRSDVLVIIPITGNAANDAGGYILRLYAPVRRESYDADLHRFQDEARKQFAAWATSLDPHQSRTDILGTLDAARQDLGSLPQTSNQRLIIVSDFTEDDGTYRFVSDGSLADSANARVLAARLHAQHGFGLNGIGVCLGRLESTDFAPLPEQRKVAIDAFWKMYLGTGKKPVEIRIDGTELLTDGEHSCSR